MATTGKPLPELLVADAAQLREWLVEHGETSTGVRLVLTKKVGTETTLTWQQAVEEGLCQGWIDGQAGKRDEGSYTVRFTPRRPRSMWSRRNVELVAQLERQGRMRAAGRAAVEAAKADGRWDDAYAGPATAEPPQDLLDAIADEPAAQAWWDVLTRTNRYSIISAVLTAKREETRARRIRDAVTKLARGETPAPQRARPE